MSYNQKTFIYCVNKLTDKQKNAIYDLVLSMIDEDLTLSDLKSIEQSEKKDLSVAIKELEINEKQWLETVKLYKIPIPDELG